MKKTILIVLLFLNCLLLFGQEESTESAIRLNFNVENIFLSRNSYRIYSLNIELPAGKRWSLNYRFGYGLSGKEPLYHLNSGIRLGLWSVKNSNFFDDLLSSDGDEESDEYKYFYKFLLFLLPEGINYRIPLNSKSDLSLFINPLGYEYSDGSGYWTMDIGIKFMTRFYRKLIATPYIGYKITDYYKGSGPVAGVSLGFAL